MPDSSEQNFKFDKKTHNLEKSDKAQKYIRYNYEPRFI